MHNSLSFIGPAPSEAPPAASNSVPKPSTKSTSVPLGTSNGAAPCVVNLTVQGNLLLGNGSIQQQLSSCKYFLASNIFHSLNDF